MAIQKVTTKTNHNTLFIISIKFSIKIFFNDEFRLSLQKRMSMVQENTTRINKFLSEVGYCSRRMADKLVKAKEVTINGKLAENGSQVAPTDEVRVKGKLRKREETLSQKVCKF